MGVKVGVGVAVGRRGRGVAVAALVPINPGSRGDVMGRRLQAVSPERTMRLPPSSPQIRTDFLRLGGCIRY